MKKHRILTILLMAALGASLAGCASIIDGGRKTVNVRSEPSGAKVTVFDKKGKEIVVQNTPALLSLKRARGYFTPENYRVVIEKEGYKPFEIHVRSTVNGWYAGNLIFGGLIGLLIVDPATGAMWTLSPKEVIAELTTTTSTSFTRDSEGFVVVLREQLTPAQMRSAHPLPGVTN